MILDSVTITGLPLELHEGKVLNLRPISYLFGANGSGKTLVLRNITQQAKQKIKNEQKEQQGYFAQRITATPQNIYQDSYSALDRRASDFDLENEEISGQAFYQHLDEYPETKIKIRDALQKYLGKYLNLQRRGINNVMRFLRDEENIPEYSPQQESDGLRRLTLLLTYVYHPKCLFLAIDEPELYLHPDMISFLLEEIHNEIQYNKQFIFATHSPEMIRVGSSSTYAYLYFNLKDRLRDTHIIQASEIGADKIIEQLGHRLDVNRRAFLYAPITLFVEGLQDEVIYSKLKTEGKVKWHRRIFMVNTGGISSIFIFWLLWRKFDKDCRVVVDSSKSGGEKQFEEIINQFSSELGIDLNLSLEEKKIQLEQHNVFVAPYSDVLNFGNKSIKIEDLDGVFPSLDLTQHIDVLQKAIQVVERQGGNIRKEEQEWLIYIAKELFGYLVETNNDLDSAITKLNSEHPTLKVTKFDNDPKYLAEIKFDVGEDRKLFIKFGINNTDTEYGVL